MKGHNPFKCKKELETANLKNKRYLELGMIENLCDCENKCKKQEK